jgi:UDP-N-acetylglucosamine--N-acetylmuramyl-(pentapeptide) pyrophosphoryl-undecaprenol N-acetylglucosamine transferase
MPDEPIRVIIAAGGTGGHIMPAVAMAKQIAAMTAAQFLFVGTGRPAESAILDPLGFRRQELDVTGLKGKGILGLPGALWKAFKGLIRSISIIREFKPDLCLATGGYVCGPIGVAVFLSGTPMVIDEQNTRPGLTNRCLSRLAKLVFLGFSEAESFFPKSKVRVVGNPVRREIADLAGFKRNFEEKPLVILLLGGSQGAKRLNKAGVELAGVLKEKQIDFSIIHQTGDRELNEVENAYRRIGVEATVKSFFSDMKSVYQKAHLAVTRAGALTIAELAASNLPSVLVPLPTAADDHQTLNAQSMVAAKAALMVKEDQLAQGDLTEIVLDLATNPGKLAQMSKAADNLPKIESAILMARMSLELVDRFKVKLEKTDQESQ